MPLQVVKDAGKEMGLPELAIAGFVRFQCGGGAGAGAGQLCGGGSADAAERRVTTIIAWLSSFLNRFVAAALAGQILGIGHASRCMLYAQHACNQKCSV